MASPGLPSKCLQDWLLEALGSLFPHLFQLWKCPESRRREGPRKRVAHTEKDQ